MTNIQSEHKTLILIKQFLEVGISLFSIDTGHGTFNLIAYFCEHSSLITMHSTDNVH